MSQATIFSLHSSHVGFADNLVSVRDELWIDFVSITDPEKTVPPVNLKPE